jgi:N-acetyl-gamma-glutamylphosphate reductase
MTATLAAAGATIERIESHYPTLEEMLLKIGQWSLPAALKGTTGGGRVCTPESLSPSRANWIIPGNLEYSHTETFKWDTHLRRWNEYIGIRGEP